MVLETDGQPGRTQRTRHTFVIDRKRPAAIQVYEDLRSQIISLQLEPGASLSRLALVEHYGISQTPVRDAFILLEKEGLIEVYPQSKTLVSRIDLDHARETQFLRTAFEIEIGRLLANRADKSALEEAESIWSSQKQTLDAGNQIELFRDLDYQFHAALSDAAGQTNLWRLIISRSGHIDRLRNLHLPDAGKANKVLADHRRILDAIEKSKADDAADAIREHLSGTLSSVQAIVEKDPTYF